MNGSLVNGWSETVDGEETETLRRRLLEEAEEHANSPTIFTMGAVLRTANALYKEAKARQDAAREALDAAVMASDTETPWRYVGDADAFAGDFHAIRVACDRVLDAGEITRVSGTLGYALRTLLAGGPLSEPTVVFEGEGGMVLEYVYDSSKIGCDAPDFHLTFGSAHRYAEEGTPIRRSNRAGRRTRGLRLLHGIGDGQTLRYYVR